MALFLESEGHTKTSINGKVVNDRSYEAISNSKGTNLLIKQNGKNYLVQDNPILKVPANPKSIIERLNNDFFMNKVKSKTNKRKRGKRKNKTRRKHGGRRRKKR